MVSASPRRISSGCPPLGLVVSNPAAGRVTRAPRSRWVVLWSLSASPAKIPFLCPKGTSTMTMTCTEATLPKNFVGGTAAHSVPASSGTHSGSSLLFRTRSYTKPSLCQTMKSFATRACATGSTVRGRSTVKRKTEKPNSLVFLVCWVGCLLGGTPDCLPAVRAVCSAEWLSTRG